MPGLRGLPSLPSDIVGGDDQSRLVQIGQQFGRQRGRQLDLGEERWSGDRRWLGEPQDGPIEITVVGVPQEVVRSDQRGVGLLRWASTTAPQYRHHVLMSAPPAST
jgi:hypothetical protein